ncbi:MAG: hypothetical protein CFE37_09645 [Alphaproteobacteria bacterium PA4]|nr:MAG: hypothetical protein CFE37_09645 [Alphaproteobacteria bacterium PA4]
MSDAMRDERLTLLGQSPGDLPAISALLQDATLRAPDLGFDRRARRLALIVNRYRWEAGGGSRVRCALRLETVLAVQRLAWPRDPEAVLNLLALTQEGDQIRLDFAGGAALRAQVEVVEVVLEDLAAPWATARRPTHEA